jgi:nucleotide-binding universal stress UspA family protein
VSEIESQALPWQVKVLEGQLSVTTLQDGQPPGVIQLVGRALPLQGVRFGGEQREQTTWYPGNPVASQQVIGPTEEPTEVKGEWNDRYLGDGVAYALAQMFDQIRKSGASVEVSWGGGLTGTTESPQLSGTPVVRVGLLKRFIAEYDRIQDIRWEATYKWRSQGESSLPIVAATGKINPREGFSDVIDDLQLSTATWDSVRNGPQVKDFGLPQAADDAMSRAFEAVDQAVDTIQRASGTITSAVVIPTTAALQLIGACDGALVSIAVMEETVLGLNLTLLEVRDSALDLLRIKDQLFDVLSQTGQAKETCADAAAGIAADIEPDVIASVRAPAGTDLRDLALRYYGDADMWWAIANYNNIDGSAVPSPPAGPSDDPARPILIPRPQPGASSDLRAQC